MSKEKAISPEELEEVAEGTDEGDRRAFLRTAAQAAGALAIFSVAGALMTDEAKASVIIDCNMTIASNRNGKQLSFSGRGLGEALQREGLIPSTVKDVGKAEIQISLKWG